MKVAISVCSAG